MSERTIRLAPRALLIALMTMVASACVEVTVHPVSGCTADSECPEGLLCMESPYGKICDKDQDGNGTADLVDLGVEVSFFVFCFVFFCGFLIFVCLGR